MIVEIDKLEAEVASTEARDLSHEYLSKEPTLVSLFHENLANRACKEFAGSLLPAAMVIAAIIKARRKLSALHDASSNETHQFDRICKATIFTTSSRPAERRVRLTLVDAQIVRKWASLN